MNKNEKYNNDRAYQRTQDVSISTETQNDLMKIMTAHAAAGNTDMFKLLFTSLGKTSSEERLENIEAVLAQLAKKK
tara:strand:+ start:486 stop:713 length:228 start_codon:yes stop_codon:yes gene_type:complete